MFALSRQIIYGTTLSEEAMFTTQDITPVTTRDCIASNTPLVDFGITQVALREEQRIVLTNNCDSSVRIRSISILPPGDSGFMLRTTTNIPIQLQTRAKRN